MQSIARLKTNTAVCKSFYHNPYCILKVRTRPNLLSQMRKLRSLVLQAIELLHDAGTQTEMLTGIQHFDQSAKLLREETLTAVCNLASLLGSRRFALE